MQDYILVIIAALLFILVIELSVVFIYTAVFLRDAIELLRRIKTLEGDMEEKIKKFEEGLTSISGQMIKGIIKGISKISKK